MTISVSMTVNGKTVSGKVEARTLLVQFLREHLGMTGTHVGCDTSQCGACVVHVDGKSIKSCTILAVQAEVGIDDLRFAGGERLQDTADLRTEAVLQRFGTCAGNLVLAEVKHLLAVGQGITM